MNDLKKQKKCSMLDNWSISKESIASNWIDASESQKNLKLYQGEIYLCELGENIGYEICKVRPVLIISDSRYSDRGQVVIIPITKNTRPQSTHYILKKNKYDFLTFDSCVKSEQIRSVSSIRLIQKLGKIDSNDINNVKIRLKTLFSI